MENNKVGTCKACGSKVTMEFRHYCDSMEILFICQNKHCLEFASRTVVFPYFMQCNEHDFELKYTSICKKCGLEAKVFAENTISDSDKSNCEPKGDE